MEKRGSSFCYRVSSLLMLRPARVGERSAVYSLCSKTINESLWISDEECMTFNTSEQMLCYLQLDTYVRPTNDRNPPHLGSFIV